MKQNTFHSLTANFIRAIISCLPSTLPTDRMQFWIEKPMRLQEELKKAFESGFVLLDENDKKFSGRLPMRIIEITGSTFHRQTAKFIGVLSENIPEISNERMRFWIGHENTLQRVLGETLDPEILILSVKKTK